MLLEIHLLLRVSAHPAVLRVYTNPRQTVSMNSYRRALLLRVSSLGIRVPHSRTQGLHFPCSPFLKRPRLSNRAVLPACCLCNCTGSRLCAGTAPSASWNYVKHRGRGPGAGSSAREQASAFLWKINALPHGRRRRLRSCCCSGLRDGK